MNHQLIERLAELTDEHVQELCDVLIDCVEGGASVGFMLPFTRNLRDRPIDTRSSREPTTSGRFGEDVSPSPRKTTRAWFPTDAGGRINGSRLWQNTTRIGCCYQRRCCSALRTSQLGSRGGRSPLRTHA